MLPTRPKIYIFMRWLTQKLRPSPAILTPLVPFCKPCRPSSQNLPNHRLQQHSMCTCTMSVNATHQTFDDPERCAPDAQCVVLHVLTQQALEAAQAQWRQAVVALAAVQLHQQGDAVQGLLPHLLVLTGELQGDPKQVVNGGNFAVCFICFQNSL